MKVLVMCEYSGRVRRAFEALGHDVLSADFEPSEDRTHRHYRGDCFDLIESQPSDLLIAHPPCTYLARSGMHWTARGLRDPRLTDEALEFVRRLMAAPVPRIAIENPIGVISTRIRPPDQIITPYMFGDDASKRTCLWLKGLPPLKPTKLIAPRLVCCGRQLPNGDKYGCPNCCGEKRPLPRWGNQLDSGQNSAGETRNRWKDRSRTFQGIADAMAQQWGALPAPALVGIDYVAMNIGALT